MKIEITVPAMGESIIEATIGEILKPSGSPVAGDDEILEIETDKVNQVLYAPKSGTLTLNVKSDDTVTIGQVIGFVDTEGAAAEAPPPKKEAPEPAAAKPPKKEAPPPSSSPGARKTKEAFVESLQKSPTPTPPQTPKEQEEGRFQRRKRLSKLRKVIAERLVEVKQETAMLTTFNEVDMSHVIDIRNSHKESFLKEHGVKLGFMSFFVKGCAAALQQFPEVNAYLEGGEIVYNDYIDISVAVSTDRGLVVPVLKDCQTASFADIEERIATLATKAREGTIDVSDLQGGTFTITNGGIYGSLLSTPILNPPQSGILGMHAIKERPIAIDGEVVIRPMMYIALSYDHRIVDGKEAVSFLVALKNCLEDPSNLLLEL